MTLEPSTRRRPSTPAADLAAAGASVAFARLPRRRLPCGRVLLIASTFRARLAGLTRTPPLPPGLGLLLPACRSVHTFGMAFALDLIWLDAAGAVLRVDADVAPRRLRSCPGARSVVEVTSGAAGEWTRALAHAAGGCAVGAGSDPASGAEAGVPPEDCSVSRLPSSDGG